MTAGHNASEVLELVEETSDEVALAVQVMGYGAPLPAVPLGRDVGARAMVGDAFEDGAGVAAAVGDGVPGRLKAVKEGRHGSLVGGLARSEREAARQAKAVDNDVDFGAQPASRASDGVVRTPFFRPRRAGGRAPPRRRGDEEIPLIARRSSTRGTPRGLSGGNGEMIAHSASVRSCRPRILKLPLFGSLNRISAGKKIPFYFMSTRPNA